MKYTHQYMCDITSVHMGLSKLGTELGGEWRRDGNEGDYPLEEQLHDYACTLSKANVHLNAVIRGYEKKDADKDSLDEVDYHALEAALIALVGGDYSSDQIKRLGRVLDKVHLIVLGWERYPRREEMAKGVTP